MGSSPPDVGSPSLILTRPTPAERTKVWTMTHPKWGAALTLDDYLGREVYLTTVPLAKDGGLTQWILTDSTFPPDQRPILSSCESLRKRALSASSSSSGELIEGIAHGIASVFTDPQYRGRGYASRMMRELGKVLRRWQVKDKNDQQSETSSDASGPESLFSVLYSDIGKTFYARNGWAPHASSHVQFAPVHGASSGLEPQNGYRTTSQNVAKPIGYHELAELCSVDERLLRETLKHRVTQEGKKNAAAILPDLDSLLWHLMREDYMTKHIFGQTPAVKGAVWGEEKGKRMWAVWTRGYYGGLEKIEGNTLHILRFVVEDEGAEVECLREGFRSIVQIAQAEAAEWRSQDVQMWNPTPLTKKLVEGCGLEYEFVERDKESIASLMWYGEGQSEEVDWVANEKYGWC
ncbi:hypothetical protein B0H66DRAFT_255041 [Apodospora peruviana]|uniref:LYC1 C-terminal domain-containing protein n=1 Tax=Apodospora peruviana TaxID=516989 RepID=A0AAE0I606_9PEZI|nr:hypothetical protein B0H66DRAFT_255041 [Apodospora peruviana]